MRLPLPPCPAICLCSLVLSLSSVHLCSTFLVSFVVVSVQHPSSVVFLCLSRDPAATVHRSDHLTIYSVSLSSFALSGRSLSGVRPSVWPPLSGLSPATFHLFLGRCPVADSITVRLSLCDSIRLSPRSRSRSRPCLWLRCGSSTLYSHNPTLLQFGCLSVVLCSAFSIHVFCLQRLPIPLRIRQSPP